MNKYPIIGEEKLEEIKKYLHAKIDALLPNTVHYISWEVSIHNSLYRNEITITTESPHFPERPPL